MLFRLRFIDIIIILDIYLVADFWDINSRDTSSISLFSSKWWDVGALSEFSASDVLVHHLWNMQVNLYDLILMFFGPFFTVNILFWLIFFPLDHLFLDCSGLRSGCFAIANLILVRPTTYGFFFLFLNLLFISWLSSITSHLKLNLEDKIFPNKCFGWIRVKYFILFLVQN